jgi:hypothetical protein
MIRYRLDDLGWFQFEWLIQGLLKADLGMVQSWGGRHDGGRDAYIEAPLPFPAKHITSDGPFLFQVKFVENANAAGAHPGPPLLGAVQQEARLIKARLAKKGRIKPVWKRLAHYVLLTNAIPDSNSRNKIQQIVNKVLPQTEVHVFGGTDICDLLDRHPDLRKSFPQLLSLRDLDDLLVSAVNRDIIERSEAAISLARDVVNVFVPTDAYAKALEVLAKHNFVVLEGPPEMGKTAIGWMVALVQICQGWQAVVCNEPDEFFKSYDRSANQILIADDAFGRTEYDTARGKKWERDLDKILHRIDSRHWLIWTTRKHIWERARRSMDLQGKAENFPNPAAVLVDASRLTVEDKALILYRHARASGLEAEAKKIVKGSARGMVSEASFTPERIRRFVDRVSSMARMQAEGRLTPDAMQLEIREVVRNPTDRMRKSFTALPGDHKWLLVSLLEAGHYAQMGKLKTLFTHHCATGAAAETFADALEELTESFVRIYSYGDSQPLVSWVHPSYRDLVIEELSNAGDMRRRFLEHMSLEGIKLAVSDTGGQFGDRKLPLMNSDGSWSCLHGRCVSLISENPVESSELLETLVAAISECNEMNERTKLTDILRAKVRELWDSGQDFYPEDFAGYCRASIVVQPLLPLPRIDKCWERTVGELEKELEFESTPLLLDLSPLSNFLDLIELSQKNEPRWLTQLKFPEAFSSHFARVFKRVDNEMKYALYDERDEDDMHREVEDMRSMAAQLERIAELTGQHKEEIGKLVFELRNLATAADENLPREPDDDDRFEGRHDGGSVDVDALFADL